MKFCFWAIEVEKGIAIIRIKENEKGFTICNVDKRHHLKFIQLCLYHSNLRRFGVTKWETDDMVNFALQPDAIQKNLVIRKDAVMPNTSAFLRIELEKKNIFRGARCKQHKKAHNYFEKKGDKYIDLKVTSKEAVYELKGWKLPQEPKEKS